jgi:hypothetical protein
MIGTLLKWILFPEDFQPEAVCWSSTTLGHASDPTGKQILHRDIVLNVSEPYFDRGETWVYLVVSNMGSKALGFGADGIALTLLNAGQTTPLRCRALKTVGKDERESERLMVNSGSLHFHFVALFQPSPKPEHCVLAIQANRMLARPFFYTFPFELRLDQSCKDVTQKPPIIEGGWEELLKMPRGSKFRVLSKEEADALLDK